MLFSSLIFLYIFLPFLFILYFINKNINYKNIILLIFSLFFYFCSGPIYALLLFVFVLINYFLGILIEKYKNRNKLIISKLFFISALILNIGVLFYYKYTILLIKTVNELLNTNFIIPDIILPVGISFFVFQTLSYIIDIYRKEIKAQRSFGLLLLYISMFPQLVAGPIVRYCDIKEQLKERKTDLIQINEGIFRFSAGLAKKVLIANSCCKVSDQLLNIQLNEAGFTSTFIGIIFFSFYIYYDFSGYSDMAIGLGKIVGFDFKENFNYPYISKTAGEFWRRWHISLGTFFREYLYIPLGGNRRFWLRNVLVVWLLTGMWHGASWNFLLWGLFYAILLISEKYISKLKIKLPSLISEIILRFYMLSITIVGWTIFYYKENTLSRLKLLFDIKSAGNFAGSIELSLLRDNIILLITAIIFAFPVFPFLSKKMKYFISYKYNNFPSGVENNNRSVNIYQFMRYAKTTLVLISLIICTAALAGDTYSPFLYFKF